MEYVCLIFYMQAEVAIAECICRCPEPGRCTVGRCPKLISGMGEFGLRRTVQSRETQWLRSKLDGSKDVRNGPLMRNG